MHSEDVRALTERLVSVPSVSPDVTAENAVADALMDALPSAAERGTWPVGDGRRVVWARLRGRGGPALLMLGHLDTVGALDYAALGSASLAFDPSALRARLLESRGGSHAPQLASDLAEERRRPGTWMFGRGALDMKSGLAAGVAALERLASAPPAGDVWLVVTPDEEHESAGMLAAVPQLAKLTPRFAGALNLDYTTEPAAYAGVIGKALVGIWVRGVPTHAGDPFAGLDAIQLAAGIARRLSSSSALRDAWNGRLAPPPVALRLRDLKARYDVQTAGEALMEWNVLSYARPLETTLAQIERETRASLDELTTEMRALSGDSAAWHTEAVVRGIATLPAGRDETPREGEDARAFSLRVVRERVAAAGIEGPIVVTYVLPPFYPAAQPRSSPWITAASAALEREGVPTRPFFPFISDASYLSVRGMPPDLGTHMPSWLRGYRLPVDAMAALDLEVLNLGPWGRDAHGVGERVHAEWAFERLPGLIVKSIEAAS